MIRIALSLLIASGIGALAAPKPNVVLILADDLGYADVGFQGSKEIKTPHLDALAASGVVCTSGYSSHPFCSPMRAGLLTGRYQQRFGYVANVPYAPQNAFIGLSMKEKTIAKRLQGEGYVTGGIGKWHVGAAHPFHPLRRGFDHYYGFLGGGHDYFKVDLTRPMGEGYNDALQRDGKPESFEGYLTDRLSDEAVAFIEAKAGGEKPFFLNLSYNAPHTPLQAPEEWLAKYAGIEDKKRRTYAAMVGAMDHGIGRVMGALEKAGVRKETLVFFLSDNGGPEKSNFSDNGALRGQKGDVFEGGVRVPFVVSWPAVLKAGMTFDAPVSSLDASCTTLALAGVEIEGRKVFDGVNLIPYFKKEKVGVPHEALFWRKGDGDSWAVRSGRWKLLKLSGHDPALFDLDADIAEENNVAKKHPDVVSALRADYSAWDADNMKSQFPSYRAYHDELRGIYKEMIGR